MSNCISRSKREEEWERRHSWGDAGYKFSRTEKQYSLWIRDAQQSMINTKEYIPVYIYHSETSEHQIQVKILRIARDKKRLCLK